MRKLPAIPRLDGGPQTVLLVEDVERAVDFYANKLRLERRDGDSNRYAEFDTGSGGVLVLVKQDGSIAPMAQPAAADAPMTLVFNIDLPAYETWRKWFAKVEVPIERETKWIHGGKSLFVRDPDGRRLEFKTPPLVTPPKPTVVTVKKSDE